MKIAIILQGEKGEFQSSIIVDGEKGSILHYDKDTIIGHQGKAIVNVCDVSAQKAKVIETTEKYDKNGKLVEKIVREITEDDESVKAALCAKKATERAMWDSGRCDRAVISVSNGLPSGSYS
jgi:hypothetical protein